MSAGVNNSKEQLRLHRVNDVASVAGSGGHCGFCPVNNIRR
jgi:hypothetical protein